jgi:hypothetical protein
MDEKEEMTTELLNAIDNFYKLKTNYETDKRKELIKLKKIYLAKRKSLKRFHTFTKDVKFKCVNCNRNVNTLFMVKNYELKAKCGDLENPCGLNIYLNRGIFLPYEQIEYGSSTMEGREEELNRLKRKIIDVKTRFILKLLSDVEAVTLFDKYNEELQELIEERTLSTNIYLILINNEANEDEINEKLFLKKEALDEMSKLLSEYKNDETKDENKLKEVIDKYITNLIPAIDELNNLTYKIKELESYDKNVGTALEDKTKKKFTKEKYMYYHTEQAYFLPESEGIIENTFNTPRIETKENKTNNFNIDDEYDDYNIGD